MGKKITPKPAAAAKPAAPVAAAVTKRTGKPKAAAAAEAATAPKLKAVKTKARTAPARKASPASPKPGAYTSDDVALRAYFIAEKRNAAGIGGEPHDDWIEAERQLAAEAAAPKRARAKKV